LCYTFVTLLRDINSATMRGHVGLVAQETQLFNRTIEV
jgi:ABC-type multidrug transport system fused ATPase/permease subunit